MAKEIWAMIPQLKRCGLIEAPTGCRVDPHGRLDSAAETLRPH